MIQLRKQLAIVTIALGCGLSVPPVAFGQNSNAPVLTITATPAPRISILGSQGLDYQLQYTSNLSTAAWQALSNFTMGAGSFAVTDHAAVSNQIRLYRALLLSTNAAISYAPAELNAAELFQFSYLPPGMPTTTETLALNSPSAGLFLRPESPSSGRMPLVSLSYNRLGPFLAQLMIVHPASESFPSSQTNYFTMVFTSPTTGFFQVSDGVMSGPSGQFTRNQSFVGQQIAPLALLAGQTYSLIASNISSVTTNLVINSPSTGMFVALGFGPSGTITPVELRYELLGPLAAQLEVIHTIADGQPVPRTNVYWLAYLSATNGASKISGGIGNFGFGSFSRTDNLVGQQIAPQQLGAGEIIHLVNASGFLATNKTSLILNSPSNAMMVLQHTSPPNTGVFPVEIQYLALGPVSCQLDVVIPPVNGNPLLQTNRHFLVYSSTNGGHHQFTTGPQITVGDFTHVRSLVGALVASGSLAAGEVYSLSGSGGVVVGGSLLIMNSSTNGSLSWLPPTSSLEAGIFPATVRYTLLGPLSASLEVITITVGGNPQPQTNNCYLAYVSTNGGFSQGLLPTTVSPGGFGLFTRNRSLVGQQPTTPQLAAGEIYELLTINQPMSNRMTLVINSATNGLVFWEGLSPFVMGNGLSLVDLKYTQVGPLDCQLEIIFPPNEAYPSPQTNVLSFAYAATNDGLLQITSGPSLYAGTFHRDSRLVGQQIAPLQLSPGESYQIGTSNSSSSAIVETLLVNATTTGILVTQGAGPDAGIFPDVALSYTTIGNLSAQLTATIPATPPMLDPRTNHYWFIYTTTNAGVIRQTTVSIGVTLGRFQRQPSQ